LSQWLHAAWLLFGFETVQATALTVKPDREDVVACPAGWVVSPCPRQICERVIAFTREEPPAEATHPAVS